jgi:hypothetical protein
MRGELSYALDLPLVGVRLFKDIRNNDLIIFMGPARPFGQASWIMVPNERKKE